MSTTRIVYDPVLKRPACVLLQAAYGCDSSLSHQFDTEDWLLAPTENMGVMEVTEEQLALLPEITRTNRLKNRSIG